MCVGGGGGGGGWRLILSFKSRPPLRREEKMKIAVFLPLKVYPFTIINKCKLEITHENVIFGGTLFK